MNKGLTILRELSSNARTKGRVSVQNDGRFLARFEVSYELAGEHLNQISGRIYEGQKQTLFIPGKASNIKISVEELIIGFPEIWKNIFSRQYPYAGQRAYRIWGESLNAKFGELNPITKENHKKNQINVQP